MTNAGNRKYHLTQVLSQCTGRCRGNLPLGLRWRKQRPSQATTTNDGGGKCICRRAAEQPSVPGMSFKDVRDLGEQLKLLGFPRIFPLQALANPHGSLASFHIVAELLQWLSGLMEPGSTLPGGVDTEEQRIHLIRSATEFFVTKAAIRLNPRKLYAAAAVTAQELQKITRLLTAPGTGQVEDPAGTSGDQDDQEQHQRDQYRSLNPVDIGDKMEELRRARELATDLTQRGATLHDLLSKELQHKEQRLAQAQRPLELLSVERTLKNAIQASQLRLQTSRAQLEAAKVELNALGSKLQRRRAELERTRQRLEALHRIRPAHMAEFEECEKELQQLFQRYFLRLHVRDALRSQLEMRTKRTTPIASPVLQKPAESSMPFIPEGLIEDDDDEDGDGDDGDDDDLDDEEDEVGGVGGGGGLGGVEDVSSRLDMVVNGRSVFGLDSEIPDIRDEDKLLLLQQNGVAQGKRPGTATSRIRPTTGRSRKGAAGGRTPAGTEDARAARASRRGAGGAGGGGGAEAGGGAAGTGRNGRNGPGSSMLNSRDDDSSFGSSDSELDVGEIMGMSGMSGISGISGISGMSNMALAAGDDEFDLNSIDDISISKLTGELPLRPKTANKAEHHSDEDF
ncbi:clusterin-associated protein 1 isoform X2 [Drosophila kikkawai]|uniref:Clusterin-associated protein 1 isoform X2 n=1 Tax=Drosophila kikkawai TaxID=30033 RepID=A0ABM4GNX6_DROKI